jgi:tetratricopeptide (TPR) repeat protein
MSPTVVSTYAERPRLSQELVEKLGTAQGGELAHAVAVIGLGGTGKTRLVLRYIHEHQDEYDTVLWLDVQSVETVRSGFERCCHALGLPVEATLSDGPLQDLAPVQAVLSWLRARSEEKRWLVVMDNADDPAWVSSIVPKGKAGTVIVTSQDARASRLLGGRTARVNVDAMKLKEAVCVLEEHSRDFAYQASECSELIEEIAEILDRLALALDLAGARIKEDVKAGNDVRAALRQYLSDYRHNQDELLRDEDYSLASPYKKTVWTTWETSLASLRNLEQSRANIYPIHLLHFMTLLNRANVQEELFRLASVYLEKACSWLGVEVPAWMQGLITKRDDGEWNSFPYRTSINLLLRYGLVRPVAQPWKGITMHSLVQWRASVDMDRDQYWYLYLAFITAVCKTIREEAGIVRFRRHVVVHLPANDLILYGVSRIEPQALWRLWATIAKLLSVEQRWKEAEGLLTKKLEATSRMLGREHPKTLHTMAGPARTYGSQGRLQEAESLLGQVVEVSSGVLGKENPITLSAMTGLASTYGKQDRLQEAEELSASVIESSSRLLGEEHAGTLSAMARLAWMYLKQGKLKEAEGLLSKAAEVMSRVLGDEHPQTLDAIACLALSYKIQGRLEEAETSFVEVIEATSRVLGVEDPLTVSDMAGLAGTYEMQGRSKEADELFLKVVEARSRALGDEHYRTLRAIANLARIRELSAGKKVQLDR